VENVTDLPAFLVMAVFAGAFVVANSERTQEHHGSANWLMAGCATVGIAMLGLWVGGPAAAPNSSLLLVGVGLGALVGLGLVLQKKAPPQS
jgi:hypothetical protein